jgi:hypothetical protein
MQMLSAVFLINLISATRRILSDLYDTVTRDGHDGSTHDVHLARSRSVSCHFHSHSNYLGDSYKTITPKPAEECAWSNVGLRVRRLALDS